jgi:hypothetical protein
MDNQYVLRWMPLNRDRIVVAVTRNFPGFEFDWRGRKKKFPPRKEKRAITNRRGRRTTTETDKMSFNQQNTPTIILLKGDTSQGRGQLISNINACLAIQDTVRTTVKCPVTSLLTARSSVLSVQISSWSTHGVTDT